MAHATSRLLESGLSFANFALVFGRIWFVEEKARLCFPRFFFFLFLSLSAGQVLSLRADSSVDAVFFGRAAAE